MLVCIRTCVRLTQAILYAGKTSPGQGKNMMAKSDKV